MIFNNSNRYSKLTGKVKSINRNAKNRNANNRTERQLRQD